jgi:hypothetical protein
LEIAILFDLSSSTEAIFDVQREATIRFLQEVMRPEDYVTIFAISSKPILVQERTKEKPLFSKVIWKIFKRKKTESLLEFLICFYVIKLVVLMIACI